MLCIINFSYLINTEYIFTCRFFYFTGLVYKLISELGKRLSLEMPPCLMHYVLQRHGSYRFQPPASYRVVLPIRRLHSGYVLNAKPGKFRACLVSKKFCFTTKDAGLLSTINSFASPLNVLVFYHQEFCFATKHAGLLS